MAANPYATFPKLRGKGGFVQDAAVNQLREGLADNKRAKLDYKRFLEILDEMDLMAAFNYCFHSAADTTWPDGAVDRAWEDAVECLESVQTKAG